MLSRAAWPVVLQHGDVRLRPLRRSDARAWRHLRAQNAAWLAPWDPTSPDPDASPRSFAQMVREVRRQAAAGRTLPFALEHEEALAGQLTVSGLMWGSVRSAQVGYWVDRAKAGRGIVPTALALAVDHCLLTIGLHRIEVNIRPENTASLRVVEKLGFRDEGLRRRYLHIDGDWRDHRTFAVTREDVPEGLLVHWLATSHPSQQGTGDS
jgi:[ribosomal protein S5]-alanine N-acetyltransferase